MRLRTIAVLFILIMVFSMSFQSIQVSGDDACCPPSGILGVSTYHELVYFQGDNPKTEEVEAKDRIWVLDRSQWSIPWNGSVVHTYVPDEAVNITIDQVDRFDFVTGTTFLPGRYSWSENPDNPPNWGISTEPEYEGLYYWSFPAGIDRNYSAHALTNTTADFEDFMDETVTNKSQWTISNGNLSLAPGVATANYTSFLTVPGREVTGVNISWSEGTSPGIEFFVSVDNGTTWTSAQNGTAITFADNDNRLRWRVSMSQDTALNNSPILEDAIVTFRYVPENLEVWIQTTYALDIEDGKNIFDITFPYDSTSSGMIFLGYFDPDIGVSATGMSISPGEQPDYPGKTVYRHMMGGYDSTITFTIEGDGLGADSSAFLFLLIAAIALGLVGAIAYSRRSGVKDTPPEGGENASESADHKDVEEPSEEELEARITAIEGLGEQKKKVLASIKRVDSELKDGIISQEDHGRIAEGYKKRAVEIMKEIDVMKKA